MSRIFKQGQIAASDMEAVVYRPISQAVAGQAVDEASCGFVPMGIFDTSGLSANCAEDIPELQEPAGPPSVTLIEEELQRRLGESFQNGLIEGKNLAERGLLNVFRALRIAAEDVHALREKVMRESEDEIVELITMVARKVILREVSLERKILANVVQSALSAVYERDEITVRLNPDDYLLVTANHEDYFRKELMTDRMRLKSDPTVIQGFCQIDSEMGTIDAGIDSQLDEIFRRLQEERTLSTVGGA